MISSRKLLKLARKWQEFTGIRRLRISFPRVNRNAEAETCTEPVPAERGHFVAYTADNRRFVFPLSYLKKETFRQLLVVSEEEFGLPSEGPIILPCPAVFMEYVVSLIHRGGLSAELEKSLLTLAANDRCSSSITQDYWTNQQLVVC